MGEYPVGRAYLALPVFFCMTRKKSLDVIGVKTIHIRTSKNDTKHVTVTVTIAADGTVLPSTVVFKI